MVWPAVVQASSFDHLSSCGPVTGPRAGNCSEPSGDGCRLLITVEGGGGEPVTVLATSDARRRSSLSTLLTAKPARAGDAKPEGVPLALTGQHSRGDQGNGRFAVLVAGF